MLTPEGTKDVLFEECQLKRNIEKQLKDVFTLRSYNEVKTPGIEFYDVFDIIPQHEMYKSTDNNNRLLVFRPDSTLPIARMAATRLKKHKAPIRLCYNQDIYRNRPDHSGRSDENTQAGIELMGVKGLKADLEVITTAVEALNKFDIDYRIEIGHAALFNALVEKLNVCDTLKENIRETIGSKNYALLSHILEDVTESVYSNAVKDLPTLFGGEEVLEKADEFCTDKELTDILKYLKMLYKTLCDLGLKERIILDLGMVQRNEYYTGFVFSAYVKNHGKAILRGGRYDNLLAKFNGDMPAVGFAIDVDEITDILLSDEAVKTSDVILYAENGDEVKLFNAIKEYEKNGKVSEVSFCDSMEETEKYAKEKGILTAVNVSTL